MTIKLQDLEKVLSVNGCQGCYYDRGVVCLYPNKKGKKCCHLNIIYKEKGVKDV